MTKTITWLISMMLTIFLGGCSRNILEEPNTTGNNLKIDFNVDDVIHPLKVKIYEAKIVDLQKIDFLKVFDHDFEETDFSSYRFAISKSGVIEKLEAINALDLIMSDFNQENLNFSSYDKALTEMKSRLSEAGLSNLTVSLFNSLTSEKIKSQAEHVQSDYNQKQLDSLDEVYLVSFNQHLNNIPILGVNETGIFDSIHTVYSKNGFEYVTLEGLLEGFEIVEEVFIISAIESINKMKELYGQTLNLADVAIHSLELVYIYNQFGRLVPIWLVELSKNEEFGIRYGFFHLIDAITGELIW